MLQGLIIKKILAAVMKAFLKKYNLDKIKSYVEDDNELDIKVRELQEQRRDDLSAIATLIKEVDKLKDLAHKPINDLTDRLNKLEGKKKG